jgi:hypothetical protein
LLLVVIHLLASAGIIFSSIPVFLKLTLLLLLPASFYFYSRRLPAASAVAVSALQWRVQQFHEKRSHEKQWQLRIDQQWITADITDVVIWADWVFLRFRLAGKIMPVNLPLCRRHFISQAEWCSLRRQLQMVEL